VRSIVISFYGRGKERFEMLSKSLAQGNSDMEPELKLLLSKTTANVPGCQGSVTGPENVDAEGHQTTLT
jgi:hypothetical protein